MNEVDPYETSNGSWVRRVAAPNALRREIILEENKQDIGNKLAQIFGSVGLLSLITYKGVFRAGEVLSSNSYRFTPYDSEIIDTSRFLIKVSDSIPFVGTGLLLAYLVAAKNGFKNKDKIDELEYELEQLEPEATEDELWAKGEEFQEFASQVSRCSKIRNKADWLVIPGTVLYGLFRLDKVQDHLDFSTTSMQIIASTAAITTVLAIATSLYMDKKIADLAAQDSISRG